MLLEAVQMYARWPQDWSVFVVAVFVKNNAAVQTNSKMQLIV